MHKYHHLRAYTNDTRDNMNTTHVVPAIFGAALSTFSLYPAPSTLPCPPNRLLDSHPPDTLLHLNDI